MRMKYTVDLIWSQSINPQSRFPIDKCGFAVSPRKCFNYNHRIDLSILVHTQPKKTANPTTAKCRQRTNDTANVEEPRSAHQSIYYLSISNRRSKCSVFGASCLGHWRLIAHLRERYTPERCSTRETPRSQNGIRRRSISVIRSVPFHPPLFLY